MKDNSIQNKNQEQIVLMHKRLDSFIQSSLDKFNFVEPWKDLYDVTGQSAYYIISNQSTIPDLVIFNKGFDKNECYVESQTKEYNKFPRKHFILHLKPQRERDKEKEKEKNQSPNCIEPVNEEKKQIPFTFQALPKAQLARQPQPQGMIMPMPLQISQSQLQSKVIRKQINSDDEEDPEWGDDDVTEFKKTKVDFKEIPIELQKELEEIISDQGIDDKDKAEEKEIGQDEGITVDFNKEPQVITGDELFQVDPETLFNPIPANLTQSNAIKKTSKKELKKDSEIRESQFKKEDDFFKDLCHKENQSENKPIIFSNNNNNSNKPNNNIWGNRKSEYLNQYPHINPNSHKSYMLNTQMKQMMAIGYNNNNIPMTQAMPMQPMPYSHLMFNNRMRNPNNFNNISMQPPMPMQIPMSMPMRPQYPNLNQINMIRQNMQMINNNTQNNPINPLNYMNNVGPNLNLNQISIQVERGGVNEEIGRTINQSIANTAKNNNGNTNNNDDDDDDDLLSDFNTKFNLYNPSVFLENPGLIVKKNLFEANWFLMKENKIIGNYNSEELFFFLSEKINEKEKLDDVSIIDFHTDVFFKPTNLLEILKEFVPKIKKKLEMKQMNMSLPSNQYINLYQTNINNNNNAMMMAMMNKSNMEQQQINNYFN